MTDEAAFAATMKAACAAAMKAFQEQLEKDVASAILVGACIGGAEVIAWDKATGMVTLKMRLPARVVLPMLGPGGEKALKK